VDYIDGEDLDQLVIRTGAFMEQDAARHLQVCEAVARHAPPSIIIHRYIKPATSKSPGMGGDAGRF
jgi:hypothetical protein